MSIEQINHLLQQGAINASVLKTLLGKSQPTLSRWVKSVPNLVRIGDTHQSKYALQREISDIGFEQGLYSIDEQGDLKPVGMIKFLAAGQSALIPPGIIYDGYFPPLYDMMPEGYMGRAFAQEYGAELGFPNQLRDWTDQQKLIAVARRGEDLIGNFILGRESAERWQQLQIQEYRIENLPELARQATAGYPAGSSAGGEQPKFSIFSKGKHFLVKFARKDGTPASSRWIELLRCEHEAIRILNEYEIPAADTRIEESDDFVFFLSERFDRVGSRGRRLVTSLSAIDNHFYGHLQRWSLTAEKLLGNGRISKATLKQIKLIEAFSMLIGDTDRHFHNLSLVPNATFEKFSLAPAYDKLPMFFAPQNGEIVERNYHPPIPEANLIEIWEEAEAMANTFWLRTNFRTFYKCL